MVGYVVIAHQPVRPEGNAEFYHGFVAPQHRNLLAGAAQKT
jgi:hypothetical protein